MSGKVERGVESDAKELAGGRRSYWRSASWSGSRSALPPPNPARRGGRSCLPPLSIARRSLDEWPQPGSDDVGEWPFPPTPRLKLDLSAIQSHPPDQNAGLLKRERIAFFDKDCSRVLHHVYVGGDAVARDREILRHHGITHVLNCVGFVCPEYFKADFVYRTLWLQDSPTQDITSILYDVFDYFEDVREQGGRVFVHCCQGVSRSTSLVIAYLMWREGQSFDDAFHYVKAARGIADPNMGFACQLLQCQKRVHAIPLSPTSLLRMYRIAPHSPYDPLHLVPKMLTDPSPSALDSRGAFIVHIPSAVYVWVGQKCGIVMEREARGSVCQIVHYEKFQGPIGVFKECEEPSYFWDAFSNLLPLMDRPGCEVDSKPCSMICPGEKKVDSYNVDFEIFQKATLGGSIPPFGSSETEHVICLPASARQSCWSVLRHKFASRSMTDFVSSAEYGVCKVYSDSGSTTVDNPNIRELYSSTNPSSSSRPSSVSSFSSMTSSFSSSSPQYPSPNSISSDSSMNSTYFSDSPAASPLAVTNSDLASTALSNLSNMSLGPSKISPQSISTSSQFIDVNFSSHSGSNHSNSSPSKKFPLCVAERRGSLSKFIKLPTVDDDSRQRSSPSGCLSVELSDGPITAMDSFSFESPDCLVETHHGQESEGKSSEDTSSEQSDGSIGGEKECLENGVVHGSSICCHLMKPLVYQWPTMDKISADSNSLDSRSAYLCITSSNGFEDDCRRMLYIWLGKNFSQNKAGFEYGSTRNVDCAAEIDWVQASVNILSELGLPIDCNVKIIKENEEPAEFLSILSSM